MDHFTMLTSGIDPRPFLSEIEQVDDAWSLSTGRRDKIEVQREAHSIPLRGVRKSAIGSRKRCDVHASRWTTGSVHFAHARQFLVHCSQRENGFLSRAKIVCLPAGRRVYPHIDRGEYYARRDRYHLVLRSSTGSWLKSGHEEVRMHEGELWWFDNKQVHEAHNDGNEDRIHLIFDLLPRASAPARLEHAA